MVHTHTTAMRKVAAREREELVTQLRAQGQTFAEIGRRIGTSGERARQIWERVSDRVPVANVEQHRKNDLELVDTNIRMLFEIALNPKATLREKTEAHNSMCRWAERRAKLTGSDAVIRREVTVLTEEVADREIHRIQAENALKAQQNGVELPALPAVAEVLRIVRD